jgi:hypothetical protein
MTSDKWYIASRFAACVRWITEEEVDLKKNDEESPSRAFDFTD